MSLSVLSTSEINSLRETVLQSVKPMILPWNQAENNAVVFITSQQTKKGELRQRRVLPK